MSALLRTLALAAAVAVLGTATPALAAKKQLSPADRIDLNRAPVVELMRLPGVGEKRAQAIVAHRKERPFRRPEDVLDVKGLGPAWFTKVKAHLVVGAATPASTPAPGGAPAAKK